MFIKINKNVIVEDFDDDIIAKVDKGIALNDIIITIVHCAKAFDEGNVSITI